MIVENLNGFARFVVDQKIADIIAVRAGLDDRDGVPFGLFCKTGVERTVCECPPTIRSTPLDVFREIDVRVDADMGEGDDKIIAGAKRLELAFHRAVRGVDISVGDSPAIENIIRREPDDRDFHTCARNGRGRKNILIERVKSRVDVKIRAQ